MATYLIFGDDELDVIEFDAVVSLTFADGGSVTRHPVEKGSPITDNVEEEPTAVAISGVVSNSQPDWNEWIDRDAVEKNRAELIYEQLLELKTAATLFEIVSEVRTVDSCVLTSITAPKTSSTGDAIFFELSFARIEIVEGETVAALSVPTSTSATAADTTEPKTAAKSEGRKASKKPTPETSESVFNVFTKSWF